MMDQSKPCESKYGEIGCAGCKGHSGDHNGASEIAKVVWVDRVLEYAKSLVANSDELAEVIARNVQPSPEQDETSIWPLSIVDETEPDEPVAYLYRVREVGKQIVEFAAVDGWRPKDPAKEVIVDKWPLYLREARPVQQPATEPDATVRIYTEATQIAMKLGQVTDQFNLYYVTLIQLEDILKRAALALRDVPQGPSALLEQAANECEMLHKIHRWQGDREPDCAGLIRSLARQVPVGPEGKK